jgi:hypothetical protein
MNCSGNYLYSEESYDESHPGILTAAVLTAVFYSVTVLTSVVLRVVGVFGGRNRIISPKSLFIFEDFEETEPNSQAVLNVVDFQRYKLFRSRRD